MAASKRRAALAMALVVGPTLLAAAPAGAAGPLEDSHRLPVPVAALDLRVAAVFVGFSLSPTELQALGDEVANTWVPFVVPTNLPIGVEYTVDLRTVEATSGFDTALSSMITDSFANDTLGRFVGNYPGLIENLSAAFPSVQQSTPVPHADADAVLQWIASAGSDFPEVAPRTDEVRLFFLNPTGVSVPYFYKVDSHDIDSGTDLTYETANAWGGTDGIFFQDLRAAPNHLGEGGDGRPANFAGQPPLWSYGSTPSERARLVADLASYVNNSVRILAAPEYAVTPYYPLSYSLDLILFDNTQAQDLFQPGGAGAAFGLDAATDVLEVETVQATVQDLLRAAPVTVTVSLSNRSTDPDIADAITADTSLGPGGTVLLDPFDLNNDLKSRFAIPDQPVLPGDAVRQPGLLVLFDGEAYVQSPGTRGATLQRSDGRAASILVAAGLGQASERGLTDTVIHEAGHSLGLTHRHELSVPVSETDTTLYVDWLRDASSTPMTYLPNYADYTFDSFDKRSVASGMAATTLAAAYIARQQAWAALDSRGYSNGTVPSSFNTSESLFLSFAGQSLGAMSGGEFYVPAGVSSAASGAAVFAKRAYDQAKEMLIDAVLMPRCCGGSDAPTFLPGPGAVLAVGALAAASLAAASTARRRRQ